MKGLTTYEWIQLRRKMPEQQRDHRIEPRAESTTLNLHPEEAKKALEDLCVAGNSMGPPDSRTANQSGDQLVHGLE